MVEQTQGNGNQKGLDRKFINYFSFWVIFLMFLFANSCGGGGGGREAQTTEDTIIPTTTKVLDESTMRRLTSISQDGSELTFSEFTPLLRDLRSGDIIVSGVTNQTPDGLLRRVISVAQENNQVIIRTRAATLEEAIQKGSLEINRELSTRDISSALALREGISFGIKEPRLQSIEEFSIGINELILYDDDGDPATTDDQIRANGRIALNPSFTFSLRIENFQLKELRFTNLLAGTMEVQVETRISKTLNQKMQIPGARYLFAPITYWVGTVPVVIRPILTVNIGIEGTVAVGITAGVTQEATVRAGLSYHNGQWSSSNDLFNNNFRWDPPQLYSGAKFRASAGPHFDLLIYGKVGPYGEIRGHFAIDANENREPWWELLGGMEADLGVRIEMLGRLLAEYELPLALHEERLLAKADAPYSKPGIISGSVKDAVTKLPLGNVSIRIYRQGTIIAEGLTDSSGIYSIAVPAGIDYFIKFSKTGYLPINYYDLTVKTNETTYLEAILQIDAAYSNAGAINGKIVNALNGTGVGGLTIHLRKGINVRTGIIFATTSTGSDGLYNFSNLEAGNYTAEIRGSGYLTTYLTVVCIGGNITGNQDASITPILSPEEIRIILTWNYPPGDLDSHLTGPIPETGERFHVYWGPRGSATESPYAQLDHDNINRNINSSPETITIYRQFEGIYRYSVHDFSNLGVDGTQELSNSGAQVRVYRGSDFIALFNVPTNREGNLWTVFEMNMNTITPINTFSYQRYWYLVTEKAGSNGKSKK